MSDAIGKSDLISQYSMLFGSLLPGVRGACLYDANLQALGFTGSCAASEPTLWVKSAYGAKQSHPQATARTAQHAVLVAIPLLRTRERLLAVACIELSDKCAKSLGSKLLHTISVRLKPALDCLHRELATAQASQSRLESMGDRTSELEWLFNVSAQLEQAPDDVRMVRQLLAAATERLRSALGALIIPDRHLSLQHTGGVATQLQQVLTQTEAHLLTWAQRQGKPLVLNAVARPGSPFLNCKLLSVPVVGRLGRIAGVLVFLNPMEAENYRSRHIFLAKHLSRQMGHLAEAEFDLMTGLFTRAALEQRVEESIRSSPDTLRSVLIVDIDRVHVVNEVHGFELGDELIVRIADILGSQIFAHNSLVARMSGDRFAVVLEGADPREATSFATAILEAASRIVIGPPGEPLDVSVSCGIAALVAMPKGMARALAAADIACKTAKDRGRNRVELYACEDSSMMRRHDDVIVVGRLREAIRHERLLVYAQPIVKLQHEHPLSGFELLIRMRNDDGSISAPADFLSAAYRYQLMPNIDRHVLKRALQIAGPHRALLRELGASISINVSGQTLADPTFVDYLLGQIRNSSLAAGMLPAKLPNRLQSTAWRRRRR